MKCGGASVGSYFSTSKFNKMTNRLNSDKTVQSRGSKVWSITNRPLNAMKYIQGGGHISTSPYKRHLAKHCLKIMEGSLYKQHFRKYCSKSGVYRGPSLYYYFINTRLLAHKQKAEKLLNTKNSGNGFIGSEYIPF